MARPKSSDLPQLNHTAKTDQKLFGSLIGASGSLLCFSESPDPSLYEHLQQAAEQSQSTEAKPWSPQDPKDLLPTSHRETTQGTPRGPLPCGI